MARPEGGTPPISKSRLLAPRFWKFEWPGDIDEAQWRELVMPRWVPDLPQFPAWLDDQLVGLDAEGLLYEIDEHISMPRVRQPRDRVGSESGRLALLGERARARRDAVPPKRFGRPKKSDSEVCLTAYLLDIEQRTAAELLMPLGCSKSTLDRWKREGRQRLCHDGVWPWAIAELGLLPGKWWRVPLYPYVLSEWYRIVVTA